MKLKIDLPVFVFSTLLAFAWTECAFGYFTFVDGSQIRRCRTEAEIDRGPVFDPFRRCPLVEATSPPAASISDYIITTEVDFYYSPLDILERWVVPGQEPIERFYEYGVNGYIQWYGPCASGYGNCYFGPAMSHTWGFYRGFYTPLTVGNLGMWRYEEFLGDEIFDAIDFELKELVLTEESTASRIGIAGQAIQKPFVFRLATFEDTPDDPHPVAGETVNGTLTGPKGAKGAAVSGIGSGSSTDANGYDSATIHLGSKPGIYTLRLNTRWMTTQPSFDFFAIDDIGDLDPATEHPETEQGVGEGKGQSCDQAGNPITLSVGNKFQREVDIQKTGISPIEFVRYHNSLGFVSASFSNYWTHTYDRFVEIPADPSSEPVKVIRPDGRKIRFTWDGSHYQSSPGIRATLEQTGDGWNFMDEDMTEELFDVDGFLMKVMALDGSLQTAEYDSADRLVRIESNRGGSLDFEYDSNDRISSVTDQSGRTWNYGYEILGRLQFVERPDGASREYHYEDLRHPYALTGITNENGHRYSTYEYDEAGLAVASYHANNADRVDVQYEANGERVVVDPLGNATVYQTRVENQRGILDGISGPVCSQGCGLSNTEFEYDAEFNITSQTSYGVTTLLGDYDSRGRPGFRIEAAGSPDERRVSFQYDPVFRDRITRITEPSVFGNEYKVTDRTYDAAGNLTRETVTGYDPDGQPVSRTIRNSFNGPFGQITSSDGPRTDVNDVTRYEYYPDDALEGPNRGRLKAIIDPNGIHVRDNIQYTATGKIRSELRPNGVVVDYGYFPGNDRIMYMTESAAGEFKRTQWEYTPAGDVSTIILDDETGQEIITRMFYDKARRLYETQSRVTRTSTSQGYRFSAEQWETYQFDGAGNVVSETHVSTDSPGENLLIQKVFDEYSRIDTITRGGVTEDHDYNPNGTLASKVDGNGNISRFTYDDFKRLTRTEQAGQAVTRVTYDIHGNTAAVTDPESQTTYFQYDDLGNLLREDSPDNGTTTNRYNASGQLIQSLDAKGQATGFTYDASGRLTGIDRVGTDYDITYSYDVCPDGVGRLCSISTGWGHTISYIYNALGETVSVVSNEARISYTYGPKGILNAIEYPSGRTVRFQNDGGGLPTEVTLLIAGAPEIILLEDIGYSPVRRPVSWRFGNGRQTSIGLDDRHRVDSIEVPGVWSWQAADYDSNDNLLGLATTFDTAAYSYDGLNRLVGSDTTGSLVSFSYDRVGNRISRTKNGQLETGSYEPGSNRIQAFGETEYTLDLNGNTVAVSDSQSPGRIFHYSSHDRLLEVIDNEMLSTLARYQYDGLGQRVAEETSSGTRRFSYGPGGELLAEIDGDGTVLHEYVYLNGNLVADLYEISTETEAGDQTEVIIDSEGAYATVSGKNWLSKSSSGALNGSYLQNRKFSGRMVTWNIDEAGLPGGNYDIFAKWLKAPGDGSQTKYRVRRINDQGGYEVLDAVVSHESLEPGDWAFLGNFEFADTDAERKIQAVFLPGDENNNGLAGTFLAADAVRLVPANAQQAMANLRYIHTDHLGTPHVVTDASGEIVWTAKYQPFGEAAVDEDPDGDLESYNLNIRFPGQYYNEATGLHYNYFRDYDPALGRYIQSDPAGLAGGINIFNYAANSPVRFIDPSGLEVVGEWLVSPNVYDFEAGFPRWVGYDFGDPRLIPPGFRVGYFNVDVSARVHFQIQCTRYFENSSACSNEDPEIWFIRDARTISTTVGVPYRFSIGPWQLKAAAITYRAVEKAKIELAQLALLLYRDPTFICLFGL